MKPFIQKRQGLPGGTFVCFFVTDQKFDLLGQEAAD
jgi:hypothetical protein